MHLEWDSVERPRITQLRKYIESDLQMLSVAEVVAVASE